MAASILLTVALMVGLSAVFVGILRLGMGAPTAVCAIVALPVVVISSSLALYFQWVLGFDLMTLLMGSGVLMLVFAGAATLTG